MLNRLRQTLAKAVAVLKIELAFLHFVLSGLASR